MTKSGFTLIELMVAMVVGLTAITSVYSLGAAMRATPGRFARRSIRLAQRHPRADVRFHGSEPPAAQRRQRPHGRVSILRRRRPRDPRPTDGQHRHPRGPGSHPDQPVP
ncbi:MAG: prepilin-type N-terminal cleavage/methylation domain-containing protein, partial [Deltaproteobacteria bacterium]|nr:prepilin-type N-terminal cleavage/methylation domain-containing protein [Deltaproteobacteria bacterium]